MGRRYASDTTDDQPHPQHTRRRVDKKSRAFSKKTGVSQQNGVTLDVGLLPDLEAIDTALPCHKFPCPSI